MWKIKKLADLSSTEFFEIMKLRIDTFVVAQERIYHEADMYDKSAYHIFYQAPDEGEVAAYARVFLKPDYLTFGRFVVSENHRGQGLANRLIEQILLLQKQKWPELLIEMEAQIQVAPFYLRHGFEKIGTQFIFEGTPHIEMRLSDGNKHL
ncbi:GNAT family N-acetyltransferase [Enterococcus sp. LJL90]